MVVEGERYLDEKELTSRNKYSQVVNLFIKARRRQRLARKEPRAYQGIKSKREGAFPFLLVMHSRRLCGVGDTSSHCYFRMNAMHPKAGVRAAYA